MKSNPLSLAGNTRASNTQWQHILHHHLIHIWSKIFSYWIAKKISRLSSAWTAGKILSEDQDPFSVANWDKVLEPLVHDIRTMVDNGVNTQGDALNSILVGKGSKFHSGSDADYEVRAFPFDFSSKSVEYTQLPVKKQLSLEAEEKMLRSYIGEIIFIQFDSEGLTQPKKQTELIESLTERHLRKRTALQKV